MAWSFFFDFFHDKVRLTLTHNCHDKIFYVSTFFLHFSLCFVATKFSMSQHSSSISLEIQLIRCCDNHLYVVTMFCCHFPCSLSTKLLNVETLFFYLLRIMCRNKAMKYRDILFLPSSHNVLQQSYEVSRHSFNFLLP